MLRFKILLFFFLLQSSISAQTMRQLKSWLQKAPQDRPAFLSTPFSGKAISRNEAIEAAAMLLDDLNRREKPALQEEWNRRRFIHDSDTLKFEYKVFGHQPPGGRSLFISMHGGGNAPASVNDQQWRNQIRLYNPEEGLYVAPRAPTNTWNLWHESHIDTLFGQLILAAILFENVNPDRIYIMGYSAGGDGVYQLATRMADHWAAAAMMAGHPNETTPENLRNIGFTLHMGAVDSAYNRNRIARNWSLMLDSLERTDPGGYPHFVQLHEGRSHWMNREDTFAISWMQAFTRNPLPRKVIWKQDDVHHASFYWLAVPANAAQTGGLIVASVKGDAVNIERNYSDTLFVRLNDKMLNLDKPVSISIQGRQIFNRKLKRTLATIYKTIEDRKDPGLMFSSEVAIVNGRVVN